VCLRIINFSVGLIKYQQYQNLTTVNKVRAQLYALVLNEDEGRFVGYGEQHAWTQKSGLWRLPYMQDIILPHNIDMMHTEKNVAKALWGTITDIS
jgi:hypothetical protein